MRSSPDERDRINFSSIRSILLFGVPNQGMDVASLMPMVGNQPNRGLLHDLEHSSPTLSIRASRFSEDITHLRCNVINFYETKRSPTALQKVGVYPAHLSLCLSTDIF